MGFFSRKQEVSEDYMPTRATAAIYSDAKDRRWFVQDLAAMDPVITAEVPESEGALAMLLYERGQVLVLTPTRLLLFRQALMSRKARLDKEALLSEIRSVQVGRLTGPVRIVIDGPRHLNQIQYGTPTTDMEPARMFFSHVLAARDKLSRSG